MSSRTLPEIKARSGVIPMKYATGKFEVTRIEWPGGEITYEVEWYDGRGNLEKIAFGIDNRHVAEMFANSMADIVTLIDWCERGSDA